MKDKYLLDIIAAGLNGDTSKVEIAALTFSRDIVKEYPEISGKIRNLISDYSFFGNKVIRTGKIVSPPTDPDSNLEMVTIILPDTDKFVRPVLDYQIDIAIDNFLEERKNIDVLLENGINPSNRILLTGASGTGKTMLAKYLASALGKNLIIMDISSSISSLLGKTGANIKKILNYAKNTSSVLLLDEFDAIAKRRDDITDLGELKRVVNVLLMEMEEWPISSLLIATSNHPELLDKAVWRRFDFNFNINLPNLEQRIKILKNQFSEQSFDKFQIDFLKKIAALLEGVSAADICRFSNSVKRRILIKKEKFINALLYEMSNYSVNKKNKGLLCILVKDNFGDSISVRELASITGLSSSGVQHHLTKLKK
jgi:ATP-dependent protease HslVU (ClpYQ) ATPase subunit